jgi:hypothetical protein
VDRGKLRALPGDQLAQLAASDELELLYLHLQSMRNFETLRGRMPALPEAKQDVPAITLPPSGAGQRVTVH